jgi:hypothetical protein
MKQVAAAKRAAAKKMSKGKGVAIKTKGGNKGKSYSARHNAQQKSPVLLIVSIVGILLIVGIACKIIFLPSYSSPTFSMQGGFLDNMRPDPVSLKAVLGSLPSGSGNAGDDYEAGYKLYKENQRQFEDIHEDVSSSGDLNKADLALCKNLYEIVLRGTQKKKMRFLVSQLKYLKDPVNDVERFPAGMKIVQYSKDLRHVSIVHKLEKVLTGLDCLRMHYEEKNPAKALEITKAQAILSWHMVNEPSRIILLKLGMAYSKAYTNNLIDLYMKTGDKTRATAATNYLNEIQTAAGQLNEKIAKLFSPENTGEGSLSVPVGDLFYVIDNDEDPAFRAEALVFLTIAKYNERNNGNRGNIKKIESLIREYSNSGNPILKAAARTARFGLIKEIQRGHIRPTAADDE